MTATSQEKEVEEACWKQSRLSLSTWYFRQKGGSDLTGEFQWVNTHKYDLICKGSRVFNQPIPSDKRPENFRTWLDGWALPWFFRWRCFIWMRWQMLRCSFFLFSLFVVSWKNGDKTMEVTKFLKTNILKKLPFHGGNFSVSWNLKHMVISSNKQNIKGVRFSSCPAGRVLKFTGGSGVFAAEAEL